MAHLIEVKQVHLHKSGKCEVKPSYIDPEKVQFISDYRGKEFPNATHVHFTNGAMIVDENPADLAKRLQEANRPSRRWPYPSASEITPEPKKEEDFKLRFIRVAYQGATTKQLVYDVFTEACSGFTKVGELRKYHDHNLWVFYGTVNIPNPEFGGLGFLNSFGLEELAKLMESGDIKRFAEPILKVAA